MDEQVLKLLLIPAVVGVVEALKQAGLPTKYCPLASILLGGVLAALLGLAYGHTASALAFDLVTGLGIGAGATGIYAVADKVGTTVHVAS
jgi:hypothetical protein